MNQKHRKNGHGKIKTPENFSGPLFQTEKKKPKGDGNYERRNNNKKPTLPEGAGRKIPPMGLVTVRHLKLQSKDPSESKKKRIGHRRRWR